MSWALRGALLEAFSCLETALMHFYCPDLDLDLALFACYLALIKEGLTLINT